MFSHSIYNRIFASPNPKLPIFSPHPLLATASWFSTHSEVLEKDLKVMDSTAASLCRDNNIAIHVFGLADEGNVMKAVCGEKIGTIVK